MHFNNSTCVCCGIPVNAPTLRTTRSSVAICSVTSAWSLACAESVVSTLQLDSHYKSMLTTWSYCPPCLEDVREVDYLVRTVEKLQKRLNHFQNKLISAFAAKGELSPSDSPIDNFSSEGYETDPIAINLPSSSVDEEFMELEQCKPNSDEESSNETWTPPSLCTLPSASSLRQRLIRRRKLMKTSRKRGRPPAEKVKCNLEDCEFEYSVNNEKAHQVHLWKVHGFEKPVDEGTANPIEGKICGSSCTKEGCEISPAARETLRLDYDLKDYKGQNEFLSQCFSIHKPARHTVLNSTRNNTFKYSILVQGSKKPVCLKTLLSIFRIRGGKIRMLTQKVQNGKQLDDFRGKHGNRGKQACNEFSHPPDFPVDGGQELPCPSCSELFSLICCLRRHVRDTHKVATSEKLNCATCGFIFLIGKEADLEAHLELHRQREAESRKFSCILPTCDKFFVNSIDLRRHVRTDHHVEGLLHCEFCNAPFTQPRGLKAHLRVFHYEVNPFRCTACKYNASSQDDLEIHKLKHAAIKYACAECGTSYKSHTTLKNHMFLHHRPRETWPLQCTFAGCGKRFVGGTNLKAHEESHQEVKTYMCEKCPKVYRTSTVMRRHMFLKHR